MPTIGIVAGEASGDLLGSHLIAALKAKRSDIEFVGIAGPKMMAQGAKSLYPMERLAVRGYFEVLRHYWGLVRMRKELARRFIDNPPDLFIGIDAPDFNLGLEMMLRRRGVKTLHYVSPSIWAWRHGRIKKIKQAAGHMLCLFPFEKPIYDTANIPATYVGHPLGDMIPLKQDQDAARMALKITDPGLVIALLPGSRQSELDFMADLFVKTAQKIAADFPDAQFLVPLVTRETRSKFESAIYRNQAQDLAFKLLFGHAHMAMAAADGIIVASGTATLEAALLKRPMVIAYKISKWSWPIMKRMGYLPWVGLPNILAGKSVVPELLQDKATPQALAEALLPMISDKQRVAEIQREFEEIHHQLKQDAGEKAAEAVLEMIG
ncbi:lipid-A-disaccharide synthase [Novimethylophilus kurashikiensis]|uniref:Lipid-A-disaccharide synthase n=1 Tax=Novimethylophilus kurashikiensis TaxID=1825523 RepID=A0A2R5F8M5_9PROT|nr:lipid-A-disaccharide synthase [Novimethylophilus kurashikiensis]GBG13021.1 lipid-A-disaccharide synthase [Novimethylophilus kurashikiensis]